MINFLMTCKHHYRCAFDSFADPAVAALRRNGKIAMEYESQLGPLPKTASRQESCYQRPPPSESIQTAPDDLRRPQTAVTAARGGVARP